MDDSSYIIDEEIFSIDVEVAGCKLIIQKGKQFKIETNNKYVDYNVKNGKLKVEEKKHFINDSDYEVVISIPYDLDELSIESGAGIVEINGIFVNDLDFDLGAGKTIINNLVVSKNGDIESGAGEVEINNSTITNLDLDMGVGRVYINSMLLGNNKIEAGIGELELNIIGDGDNSVKIAGGIGNIKVYFAKKES